MTTQDDLVGTGPVAVSALAIDVAVPEALPWRGTRGGSTSFRVPDRPKLSAHRRLV